MHLKALLQNIDAKIYGKVRSVPIRNLTHDSRCVGVGDIFIARKGRRYDGNDFSADAVNHGAIAIVSSLYNPFLSTVQIVTSHLEKLEAELAAKHYGDPSNKLYLLGVTGTNGKTTIAYLIKLLFDSHNIPAGLVGTIEHILGSESVQDAFTTPMACYLQKYLAEMVKYNKKAAAIEVTSIALALDRVAHTSFDVGILTNITLDHLDFHGSFETYVEAKTKLFACLPATGIAVLNTDCPYVSRFQRATTARVVTYGIETSADYRARDIQLSTTGTRYIVMYRGQEFLCQSAFIGRYNVYNVLAVLAAAHESLPCDLPGLIAILEKAKPPRGRLEPILTGPCPIYIDYAHTPDALDNVLNGLRDILPQGGRLIVVFGCGGDRDRSKRKVMAQVVERYGFAVVTSDNPRGEDPEAIVKEICQGFSTRNYFIEIDRKQAITYALAIASDKDIVLVAGKGHEAYQIFKHQTVAFDDKQTVYEVLASCV
ncbi:UDP-N-acetylmuramoyl-L-alanyl-D-glutamate--2,6-diaminopimelate ligase [Candidatus Chlamydia sanziniae]|nr:UDP-N-acetylmuramoyl-L-alanyl-D-glutamate--2,6-diaminopimelate ligase [Candidatus Chlamydia sanziniae]